MDRYHLTLADLDDPAHQRAIVELTDAYARDARGDGKPLAAEVRARLIDGLRAHPTTLIVLALDREARDQPVGIATCFLGFSTFQARPLLNLHDLAALPSHRGRGVGRLLLAAVEQEARRRGCCRLTLEVQENNHRARQVYAAAGFARASDPSAPGSLFLAKPLA